ncbi:MAG: hypothetical protein COW16_10410 [Sphingomonadales bacterium CG12_big_fil_rev_8_21_14_0_65_65_10]|nr:MAG: hypothetical protein COW16_10410 [Sphingomonadales bacterium CG12_big_fil_rev_8_21_14_0_65_65_10]
MNVFLVYCAVCIVACLVHAIVTKPRSIGWSDFLGWLGALAIVLSPFWLPVVVIFIVGSLAGYLGKKLARRAR